MNAEDLLTRFTRRTQGPVPACILWGALSLLAFRFLAATFLLAWRDDHYTYILLILPLSATLIYIDWASVSKRIESDLPLATAFLTPALILALLASRWLVALSPEATQICGMAAFVLAVVAVFLLCLGRQAARLVLFPLALLAALVPPSQAATSAVVHGLQVSSTAVASALFSLSGIPLVQDGVILSIPGLTLEIAPECSSIRSSSILIVVTIFFAHVFLRTAWRRLLLVLLAIPLAIFKNGLRIYTIAVLATRVDRSFVTGSFHHQGGVIFLLVALALILAPLWLLRRSERRRSKNRLSV